VAKPLPTRRATNADLPAAIDLVAHAVVISARVGDHIKDKRPAVDLILVEGARGEFDEHGKIEAVIVVRAPGDYDVYCLPGMARRLAVAVRAECKRRAGLSLASHCVVRFWPDPENLGGTYTQAGAGRAL